MSISKSLVAVLSASFAFSVMADAVNITVSDGLSIQVVSGNNPTGGEAGSTNDVQLDVNSSDWTYEYQNDLEAFWFDADKGLLSVNSGFNMYRGVDNDGNGKAIFIGDVFIDLESDGNWDYAIDLSQASATSLTPGKLSNVNYTIRNITTVDPNTYKGVWADYATDDHDLANPVRLGASKGTIVSSGVFDKSVSNIYDIYSEDDGEYGIWRPDYTFSNFDLNSIEFEKGFTAHLTMACGNDLLLGKYAAVSVPEPGTLSLLGLGLGCLIGLAGIRRKK